MKPYMRQGCSTHNINPYCREPTSPTLHDSKSAVNLNGNPTDNKKFRETTYYPANTKTPNYEFLRYSINVAQGQRKPSQEQPTPSPHFKIGRKMTQGNTKMNTQPPQTISNGWKPYNNKPNDKKCTNPQKKEIPLAKPFTPYTRNKKKDQIDDKKPSTKINKVKDQNTGYQKKAFTPKCVKKNEQSKQATKIIGSFSSTKLNREDHAYSPTSDSISSILSAKRRQSSVLQIQDFQRIKLVGEGKFGQVFLAVHLRSNYLCAIKQIKKKAIIQNNLQNQFIMEIKLQLYLSHPNILKLYGVFDDEEHIYLLLEYMEEGTLYSQLKKKKTLKPSDVSTKLRDVIEGIAYLHSEQIAHRDIKPQNIVVSHDVCKICDFGWAALCEDRRKTLCGTIDYASPELLEGKQYGTAIDLWCLGVLCYQLMIGKAPFYHISRKQTMKKIIKADLSDISVPASLPFDARNFITRLLKKNPQQRMSAEEALSHPLIRKYKQQQLQDLRVSIPKK